MVDALRRAHRIVRRSGCVIDLHPTSDLATIEVGDRVIGHVQSDDAPVRHGAADRAIAAAVEDGVLAIERSERFSFRTYGDSARELATYIRTIWKTSRIDPPTLRRMQQALRRDPRARVRAIEGVIATRLRPL